MGEKTTKNALDPEMLSEALKEQTKDTIESILGNAVKSYLRESADEDFEDNADKTVPNTPETDETPTVDEVPADGSTSTEQGTANGTEDGTVEPAPGNAGNATPDNGGDGEDGWSDFESFKVGDGEYDMTGVQDPQKIYDVWKLMKGGDEVVIKQQDDKLDIKDNETGAEYLVTLNDDGENDETSSEENSGAEMAEEPVFEITLNNKPSVMEKNEFMDDYQRKDVLSSNLPYDAPTPNETEDWGGEGAPKTDAKPWAGPLKGKGKPYGKLEEMEKMDDSAIYEITLGEEPDGNPDLPTTAPMDTPMEEGIGMADERSMKIQKGRENPRHNNAYGHTTSGSMGEAIQRKLGKIEEENKVLKSSLVKFRKALSEAFVTNYNLGKFVSLVLENSTTAEEKKNILKRFSNEAKTIEQSNKLYESINAQLKTVNKGGVSIDKPMNLTESAAKNINENTIYKSDDEGINYALDMIQRMSKLGY